VHDSGAQVASSAAFSSRCRWLLDPRTSSTPVAVWSWPTWVDGSEKCFGSRVCLVGEVADQQIYPDLLVGGDHVALDD
jgi:hypothetical protein